MDEPDDTFFSAEALQLLENDEDSLEAQPLSLASLCDPSVVDRDCGSHSTAANVQESRKRALESQHIAGSEYSIFPATSDQGPRHKRAKFEDPKRRAEVAQVRKEGACLRCRWNKCPCSTTRPCMSCISCWVSFNAKPSKLRWMDCIPFSFKDVNIYALDGFSGDHNVISQDCSALMEERIELNFDKAVQWDVDALATDFATWMAVDNVHPAATSRVGILSSVKCQRLLHGYLDEDLCANFRLLVRASSLLYNDENRPHPHYDREQLILIRSLVGAKLLKSLEAALKSTALAKAPKEKLMSLFLVLLGAIIAVVYTATTDFEEVRYQLLRILAHHAVFIAERIGLVDCDLTKQRLTASAGSLWNKTGTFGWSYGTTSTNQGTNTDSFPEVGHNHSGLSSTLPVMINRPRALFPGKTDFPRGDTVIRAACIDYAHFEPVLNGGTESAANNSALNDLLGESGAEHSSSPVPMGMTTCFLCNGPVPLDKLCPTCFGPFPIMADRSGGTFHNNLDTTLSILDSQALASLTASTEDNSLAKNGEPWQSDALTNTSLHSRESSSESPKTKTYLFKSRKPCENVPHDQHNVSSQSNAGSKETNKRKRVVKKSKKIAQQLKAMVQNSPKQNKKSSKVPPEEILPSSSPGSHCAYTEQLTYSRPRVHSQCWRCHHVHTFVLNSYQGGPLESVCHTCCSSSRLSLV